MTLFLLLALAACGGDGAPPVAVTPFLIGTPRATPVPMEPGVIFYGADRDDGAAALAAGDFNGDGSLDLVLAAAFADSLNNERPDAGEAYVFLGPFVAGAELDPAAGDQALTIYGGSAHDQFGRAAAAGDVNGDGFDDLVVGAPKADAQGRKNAGSVYIFFGSPGLERAPVRDLAEGSADAVISGRDPADLAGFSLALADVNADKLDDTIIGAFQAHGPDNARPNAGEAYVIYGRRAWTDIDLAQGDFDVILYGAEAGDHLGEAVGAGDVDGDGIADLIVPAPFANGPDNARPEAGETYVIFSDPLPEAVDIAEGERDITVFGPDEGDQLGHTVAAGDGDGDGADDLLLGALSSEGFGNEAQLAGEAHLVQGGSNMDRRIDTGAGKQAAVIYGLDAGDRLGWSVAAGDLDGDGRADLLIAATGGDGAGEAKQDAGEISLFFAQTGQLVGFALASWADVIVEGLDPGDGLGRDVFGKPPLLAADMNGDGLDDILVAAPQGDGPNNARPDAGEAYIIFSEWASQQ